MTEVQYERPTSEVLNLAADLIEEHGWGQGPETWANKNNKGYCIEGAILAALGIPVDINGPRSDYANSCAAGRAVRQYLLEPLPLWNWNDDFSRTKDQVIGALRGAASREAALERMNASRYTKSLQIR